MSLMRTLYLRQRVWLDKHTMATLYERARIESHHHHHHFHRRVAGEGRRLTANIIIKF